jgi:hypothetical protein
VTGTPSIEVEAVTASASRAGEGLSRLLDAMADATSPSPAAGDRRAGSGLASDAALASAQPGSCQSDLMVQLADAMASAAGPAARSRR